MKAIHNGVFREVDRILLVSNNKELSLNDVTTLQANNSKDMVKVCFTGPLIDLKYPDGNWIVACIDSIFTYL